MPGRRLDNAQRRQLQQRLEAWFSDPSEPSQALLNGTTDGKVGSKGNCQALRPPAAQPVRACDKRLGDDGLYPSDFAPVNSADRTMASHGHPSRSRMRMSRHSEYTTHNDVITLRSIASCVRLAPRLRVSSKDRGIPTSHLTITHIQLVTTNTIVLTLLSATTSCMTLCQCGHPKSAHSRHRREISASRSIEIIGRAEGG